MSKHVKWNVRKGSDGLTHVIRTEMTRSTKPDGTKFTRVDMNHTKFGIKRGK